MLTAIAITLLFASATSLLGFERAVRIYRGSGSRTHGLYPALAQSTMMLWFGIAGLGLLWR